MGDRKIFLGMGLGYNYVIGVGVGENPQGCDVTVTIYYTVLLGSPEFKSCCRTYEPWLKSEGHPAKLLPCNGKCPTESSNRYHRRCIFSISCFSFAQGSTTLTSILIHSFQELGLSE